MPVVINGTTGITTPAASVGNALLLKDIVYLKSGVDDVYITPTGVRALKVSVVGGGGGGGGTDGTATTGVAGASGAGGGGGYAVALIRDPSPQYTYTVGAGGAGGAAGTNNGAAGGTTEFTDGVVRLAAAGGAAGAGQAIDTSVSASASSGGRGTVTGIEGLEGKGLPSTYSRSTSGSNYTLPMSGACPIIGGGINYNTGTGVNGNVSGEGGGASYSSNTTANYAGGSGYRGVIIIEEYY